MRPQRLLAPVWRWRASAYAIAACLLPVGMGLVVALHLLRPDVNPAAHYVSEYGNDAWGWLMSVALILIAAGLIALGEGLRETVGARLGPGLMQASGAALLIAAIFSTDRVHGEVEVATLAGRMHGLTAIGAFCLLVLTMAAFSDRVAGPGSSLGRAGALALPLALAATAGAGAIFALAPEAHGLRQRLFLGIVFAWLLLAAFHLHSHRRPHPEPDPAAPDPG